MIGDERSCGKEFVGTIMVPIPPPAYGWEPLTESDICTRPDGHEGRCSGENLIDPDLGRAASERDANPPTGPEGGRNAAERYVPLADGFAINPRGAVS